MVEKALELFPAEQLSTPKARAQGVMRGFDIFVQVIEKFLGCLEDLEIVRLPALGEFFDPCLEGAQAVVHVMYDMLQNLCGGRRTLSALGVARNSCLRCLRVQIFVVCRLSCFFMAHDWHNCRRPHNRPRSIATKMNGGPSTSRGHLDLTVRLAIRRLWKYEIGAWDGRLKIRRSTQPGSMQSCLSMATLPLGVKHLV